MSIELKIPESVVQAIRLPEEHLPRDLLIELALALYSRKLLSFGKARELAGMDKYEFGILMGNRGIDRHYGMEELKDDIDYAGSE